MTTGKGNQVIKCEKSEARLGSPFCSVSFPNAAAQLWPPRADLEDSGGHTSLQAAGVHTAGCQDPTSQPCPAQVSLLPINLKSSSGWGLRSQLHAFSPEAALSGGRSRGPRGVVRPKSAQEKGQEEVGTEEGQRNSAQTSESFQIRSCYAAVGSPFS